MLMEAVFALVVPMVGFFARSIKPGKSKLRPVQGEGRDLV
jgi:hypothetical protein